MSPRANMIGRTFGRLIVICLSDTRGSHGELHYDCECECGNVKTSIDGHALRQGLTRSCGCFKLEVARTNITKAQQASITHGGYRWKEYGVWSRMRDRCENEQNEYFADYGGRGIKVCARWKDFANFIADLGRRPSPKHSLERIDNDGDYEPTNCRWATAFEQNKNKRCRLRQRNLIPLIDTLEAIADRDGSVVLTALVADFRRVLAAPQETRKHAKPNEEEAA